MVTMVTKQRYLIKFTFYETFKDEPIPLKNFTFLRQGSDEILGGVGPTPHPPLVSDVVPKPLVSEGLKLWVRIQRYTVVDFQGWSK